MSKQRVYPVATCGRINGEAVAMINIVKTQMNLTTVGLRQVNMVTESAFIEPERVLYNVDEVVLKDVEWLSVHSCDRTFKLPIIKLREWIKASVGPLVEGDSTDFTIVLTGDKAEYFVKDFCTVVNTTKTPIKVKEINVKKATPVKSTTEQVKRIYPVTVTGSQGGEAFTVVHVLKRQKDIAEFVKGIVMDAQAGCVELIYPVLHNQLGEQAVHRADDPLVVLNKPTPVLVHSVSTDLTVTLKEMRAWIAEHIGDHARGDSCPFTMVLNGELGETFNHDFCRNVDWSAPQPDVQLDTTSTDVELDARVYPVAVLGESAGKQYVLITFPHNTEDMRAALVKAHTALITSSDVLVPNPVTCTTVEEAVTALSNFDGASVQYAPEGQVITASVIGDWLFSNSIADISINEGTSLILSEDQGELFMVEFCEAVDWHSGAKPVEEQPVNKEVDERYIGPGRNRANRFEDQPREDETQTSLETRMGMRHPMDQRRQLNDPWAGTVSTDRGHRSRCCSSRRSRPLFEQALPETNNLISDKGIAFDYIIAAEDGCALIDQTILLPVDGSPMKLVDGNTYMEEDLLTHTRRMSEKLDVLGQLVTFEGGDFVISPMGYLVVLPDLAYAWSTDTTFIMSNESGDYNVVMDLCGMKGLYTNISLAYLMAITCKYLGRDNIDIHTLKGDIVIVTDNVNPNALPACLESTINTGIKTA